MEIEENKLQYEEQYSSPNFEVEEIVLEQNVFAGSGGVPDFDGEDW